MQAGGEERGGEGRGRSRVRTAVCVRQCANVGIMLSSSHYRSVGGEKKTGDVQAVRGSRLSHPSLHKLLPVVPGEP